jgi:nucleoside-triphosphatase
VRILLEGRPGVGKTTAAVRVAELLRERGLDVCGFVTEELRERGRRVGFTVRTLAGERATLAHVDLDGPPRVGKYGVDLEAFERLALAALEDPPRGSVVMIDELGKMEIASQTFRDAVLRVLDGPADVVATTHAARHAFTDALKRRRDVERIRVTHANRDDLPVQIADRLAVRRASA